MSEDIFSKMIEIEKIYEKLINIYEDRNYSYKNNKAFVNYWKFIYFNYSKIGVLIGMKYSTLPFDINFITYLSKVLYGGMGSLIDGGVSPNDHPEWLPGAEKYEAEFMRLMDELSGLLTEKRKQLGIE